jgi:hypothetical protein
MRSQQRDECVYASLIGGLGTDADAAGLRLKLDARRTGPADRLLRVLGISPTWQMGADDLAECQKTR